MSFSPFFSYSEVTLFLIFVKHSAVKPCGAATYNSIQSNFGIRWRRIVASCPRRLFPKREPQIKLDVSHAFANCVAWRRSPEGERFRRQISWKTCILSIWASGKWLCPKPGAISLRLSAVVSLVPQQIVGYSVTAMWQFIIIIWTAITAGYGWTVRGLNPGRGKRFLSSPKYPDKL